MIRIFVIYLHLETLRNLLLPHFTLYKLQCVNCRRIFHRYKNLHLANRIIKGCPYCENPAYSAMHLRRIISKPIPKEEIEEVR